MKRKKCPGAENETLHTGRGQGDRYLVPVSLSPFLPRGTRYLSPRPGTRRLSPWPLRGGTHGAIHSAPVSLVVVLALLFAFMVSACTPIKPESADRIGRPKNMAAPVTGTWRLESWLKEDASNMGEGDDPVNGEIISFSEDSMVFAGNSYGNISYKIKRVGAGEYFLHKSTRIPGEPDRLGSEIFVITAYSDENYILEIIKSHKGEIIAAIDDRYYIMKKVSDSYSDNLLAYDGEAKPADDVVSKEPEQAPSSGLLLGVRIPEPTEDGFGDYSYGTYWISSVDRVIRPVLYAGDIYLPRMDGFWKLRVEKRLDLEGIEDVLVASKVSSVKTGQRSKAFENISGRMETRNRKAIIYVGNDYACIENTVYAPGDDTVKPSAEKTLRTLPVDNLDFVDGIKITDLAGENGALAMESAISDLLEKPGLNGMTIVNDESREKSFALFRKTGHWFFKGRVNLGRNEQPPYVDFNLNLIPPSNMVAYDVLQVPWTEMKDKLPHAIDIYTSPNKDIAVVLTINEFYIYSIRNKKLSDEPLGKFPLKDGSSVIMAEWCMGSYVSAWEKSFIRNNEETTPVENILK